MIKSHTASKREQLSDKSFNVEKYAYKMSQRKSNLRSFQNIEIYSTPLFMTQSLHLYDILILLLYNLVKKFSFMLPGNEIAIEMRPNMRGFLYVIKIMLIN